MENNISYLAQLSTPRCAFFSPNCLWKVLLPSELEIYTVEELIEIPSAYMVEFPVDLPGTRWGQRCKTGLGWCPRSCLLDSLFMEKSFFTPPGTCKSKNMFAIAWKVWQRSDKTTSGLLMCNLFIHLSQRMTSCLTTLKAESCGHFNFFWQVSLSCWGLEAPSISPTNHVFNRLNTMRIWSDLSYIFTVYEITLHQNFDRCPCCLLILKEQWPRH